MTNYSGAAPSPGPGGSGPAPVVVLVHGLLLGPWALRLLGWRLRRCGFSPVTFAWRTRTETSAAAARRLGDRLEQVGAARVHVVAHSLGGMVVARLARERPHAVSGRVVLLGTPAAGSAAARSLAGSAVGGWLLGTALPELVGGWTGPPPPGVQAWGLVAGTRSLGSGRLVFPALARPNDGTVAVAETAWGDEPPPLRVSATHSQLLVSAAVAQQVCHFLVHGRWLGAPLGG